MRIISIDKMKRTAAIALFAGLLSVLSATSVYAQAAPGCNDGSSGGPAVTEILDNQAEAMAVRDKAYYRGIAPPPDPSAGMSCMDKAMGMTARLGGLFSDNFNGGLTGIVNTAVFTAGGDTAASLTNMFLRSGSGNLLINNLNNVVAPTLNQFLGNFSGGLAGVLGAYIGNFLNTIMGPINTALDAINTYIGTVTGAINTVMGYITQIQNIANQLGIALPQAVVLTVTSLLQTVQTTLQAAMAAVTGAINAAIQAIMQGIMTLIGNLTNMACDRIGQLWNDGDPNAGAESIEGSGITEDVPYFTFRELVTNSIPGLNAASAMADELNNASNTAALNRAMTDLTTRLNAPCTIRSWKTPPVVGAGTTVTALIGMMADPCP